MFTRFITSTFENEFVEGGGNNISKSKYGGMESMEGTHSLNINNRALMILNTYLENLGL